MISKCPFFMKVMKLAVVTMVVAMEDRFESTASSSDSLKTRAAVVMIKILFSLYIINQSGHASVESQVQDKSKTQLQQPGRAKVEEGRDRRW